MEPQRGSVLRNDRKNGEKRHSITPTTPPAPAPATAGRVRAEQRLGQRHDRYIEFHRGTGGRLGHRSRKLPGFQSGCLLDCQLRKGDFGPPFLGIDAERYGPEFAFGQVMGDYYLSDDVLVIKAAWGGKSLAVDFRPPSAVARVPGTQVGPFYRGIFDNVRDVLANLGAEFPQWAGTGYQIVGFGWHQGWNDRVNQTYNDEYEANMKNFIDDVRVELGKPTLPFVIATTGMNGPTEINPRALSLMNAQLAMKNFTKYPGFEGNVDVIDTRDFWRDQAVSPIDQSFHWNQNGETQFLIGRSMGDRMVGLLEP